MRNKKFIDISGRRFWKFNDTLRHIWAAKLTYFNREMNGHRNVMNLLAGKPVAPSVNTVMADPCMFRFQVKYIIECTIIADTCYSDIAWFELHDDIHNYP